MDTSALARLERELSLANNWFVSSKAMPHLERAVALLPLVEDITDPTGQHKGRVLRAQVLFQMAYQMKYKRNIPAALEYFRESLAVFEQLDDTEGQSQVHDALGVLFQAIGEPALAVQEFERALQLIATDPASHRELNTYFGCHLAGAFAHLGKINEAKRIIEDRAPFTPDDLMRIAVQRARIAAIELDTGTAIRLLHEADSAGKPVCTPWERLTVLTPLARYQLAANHSVAARATGDTCAQLARTLGDEAAEGNCLCLSAQARLELGGSGHAERDLLRALSIARENGYMGLARELGDECSMVVISGKLKDLYRAQGHTHEALEMTTLWAAFKDTLHAMEGREDVMRLRIRQQLLTDSLAKAQTIYLARQAFEENLAKERTQRNWIAAGSAVALMFLAVLAWSYARRRRHEQELAKLQMARMEQEKVIGELRVREQVERDMHDDLGAGLNALRLRTALIQRDEIDPAKRRQLALLTEQADELMGNMRQILWALNTEETDLPGTLDHCLRYARTYLTENELRITITVTGTLPNIPLSPSQRRNLFLLVKEALHNIVKHAQASEVELVCRWNGTLHLMIQDNGLGTMNNGSGRGLNNMRKRAGELGGSVEFVTSNGWCVNFELPLRNGNERAIAMVAQRNDLRPDGAEAHTNGTGGGRADHQGDPGAVA